MSFQMPTDHPIVQEVKGGVQAFLKAQQSMKDKGETQDAIRQTLGTPTVHSTNALIKWVLEQLKDAPQGKKMAEAVKTWKSWEMLLEHVPHLKVNKQFQGHLKKLEICLPLKLIVKPLVEVQEVVTEIVPTHVMLQVVDMIKKDKKCKDLHGTPPAGELERQIQAFLDKYKEQ
eukprot:11687799-Karenia_brevis.AAC.1